MPVPGPPQRINRAVGAVSGRDASGVGGDIDESVPGDDVPPASGKVAGGSSLAGSVLASEHSPSAQGSRYGGSRPKTDVHPNDATKSAHAAMPRTVLRFMTPLMSRAGSAISAPHGVFPPQRGRVKNAHRSASCAEPIRIESEALHPTMDLRGGLLH